MEQYRCTALHPESHQTQEYDFISICHDQDIDRRILHQADTLLKSGLKGLIIALAKTPEDRFDTVVLKHGNIAVHYMGLRRLVPDCPVYRGYKKRGGFIQSLRYLSLSRNAEKTNNIFRKICRRLVSRASWLIYRISLLILNRANWLIYRLSLLLYYRCRSITYPLPFDWIMFSTAAHYRAKLIFAHDLTALKAAVEIGKIWNVPIIYDSHEFYAEQKVFSRKQKEIMTQQEKEYIKQCAKVITVSDSIAKAMADKYDLAEIPETLLNVTYEYAIPTEVHALRALVDATLGEKIVLYQGGIVPNRNLMPLLRGFIKLDRQDLHLVFLGPSDPAFLASMKQQASHSADRLHIHFLEPVPQSELLNMTVSADFGVIPYPDVDLNTRYCSPNKLFEFIQAGLPILANERLIEVGKIITGSGFGMMGDFSTPDSIAQAIHAMAQRDLSPDRQAIQSKKYAFSWEHEQEKFMQLVTGAAKVLIGMEENVQ